MVISGDIELPLKTKKLPLLTNSGDKLPLFWWLVKVGRKCQIAATIFVAANNIALAAT
jgi:hypothetical protein